MINKKVNDIITVKYNKYVKGCNMKLYINKLYSAQVLHLLYSCYQNIPQLQQYLSPPG